MMINKCYRYDNFWQQLLQGVKAEKKRKRLENRERQTEKQTYGCRYTNIAK